VDRFFAQNRLSALIDGVLSSAEAKDVETAISKNKALAKEHAALLNAVELMHSSGPAQPPSGFQVRVMTQVEGLPKPGGQVAKVTSAARRIPMEAIALAALVIVIGIVIMQRNDTQVAPSPAAVPAQAASTTSKATSPEIPLALDPGEEPEDMPEEIETIPEVPSTKPVPSKPETANYAKHIPARAPAVVGLPTMPSAYRILGGGERILFKIAGVKDSTGGRLVDGNGNTIAPQVLTHNAAFRRVFLVVPSENAVKAHSKLRGLSGMESTPVTTKFPWLRPGQTLFMIEAGL